MTEMTETDLMKRITVNPQIFGGKAIIRGRRLAVEHVLGMLAAGDTTDTLLAAYPWLEPDDIRACLLYARKVVGEERIEPLILEAAT
jgi:uncharacterized protein (DUF433 family)